MHLKNLNQKKFTKLELNNTQYSILNTQYSFMKFNLAIIGCGKWGFNHVKTAHRLFGDNFKIACDNFPDREALINSLSPDIKFTTSIDDIVKDPEINAVIISTPAETHFEIAKSLLENGKHVLVEKPITLNSDDAKMLKEIADENKLILMVGHLLLFHPAILKIKEFLDENKLGRLQYIYSNRLNLGTIRSEENILWSFAPHDISVIQFLTGCVPEKVLATGAVFVQNGIHDTTLTILEFPNNVHAHIYVSWLHPFKEHRLVVIGDKSMMVFEDTLPSGKLKFYPKGFDIVDGLPVKREADFEVIEYDNISPLDIEQLHFAECVKENKQPVTDGTNAIEVLETLELAQNELLIKTK
jgi:UDP-2-acetamido-3-amino-2,3-dideoxy-glucuronate N-acetyltransferase